MLEAAMKRPGRPVGNRKPAQPTITERMVDALMIWRCDLNRPDTVREVLRIAGFGLVEIEALIDIAIAIARKRRPPRP